MKFAHACTRCVSAASKGVLVTIVENLLVAMAAKDGLEGTKTQIKQLATLLDFALRFDQQKVAARVPTHRPVANHTDTRENIL